MIATILAASQITIAYGTGVSCALPPAAPPPGKVYICQKGRDGIGHAVLAPGLSNGMGLAPPAPATGIPPPPVRPRR